MITPQDEKKLKRIEKRRAKSVIISPDNSSVRKRSTTNGKNQAGGEYLELAQSSETSSCECKPDQVSGCSSADDQDDSIKATKIARTTKPSQIAAKSPIKTAEPSAAIMKRFRKEGLRLLGQRSKSVIEIGLFLEKHKGMAEHGTYLNIIKEELKIQPRMSQHYRNVAATFADHRDFALYFEPTLLYLLASPARRAAITEILDRFKAGEVDEAIQSAHDLCKPAVAKNTVEDTSEHESGALETVVTILMKLSSEDRAKLFLSWPNVKADKLASLLDLSGLPTPGVTLTDQRT